jgi:uncharacterized protein involved in exopolysaccharide biosynthesis
VNDDLRPRAGPEYTFDDLVSALHRRRGLVVFTTLAACLCAVVVSLALDPVYETKAVFYVPKDISSDPTDYARSSGWQAAVPYESRRISDVYATILAGAEIQSRVLRHFPQLTLPDLRQKVTATGSEGGIVSVYVRDAEAERAARIANRFVLCFFEFLQNPVATDSGDVLKRLQDQLRDAEKQLDGAIEGKRAFLEQHGVASPATELNGLQQRYLQLQYDLRSAEVQQKALDREIASLEQELTRRAGIYEGTGLREKLALLRSQREGVEATVQGTAGVLRETQERIRVTAAFAADLQKRDEEINAYVSNKRSLERVRDNLGIGALQARQVGQFIEEARVPDRPVFPLLWLNVPVAGMLGFVAAITYTLVLEGLALRRQARRLKEIEAQEWIAGLLADLPARD